MEANPIRSDLVRCAADWLWSSHREMLGKENHNLVDRAPIDLPKDWEEYVNTVISEKGLDRIRENIKQQSPYGNPEWKSAICKNLA